ncbi:A/G-specific adenine glycosylase [Desulfomarina profundi]|uniref:Adenine DNA glycosylase n=1 Tax=Desulfomarina profundi TaxID=2772557 RepID=A0A8D5FG87_9BACT|nr:A/G-specific adenine glycosylase [Desulfomarina profundi]BCL60076.1 A/G-specific adenine glycosylase [Desulfomarina profundi]
MSSCDSTLQERLIRWFRDNRRDLPWRRTYDPYHVWISEIMLQQTQMERGVTYFKKWVARFPDVASVAAASRREILKYWEGLGYYSRAANLHRAAAVILEEHGGLVPCDYGQLLKLPGIGPYTAAAIASVAGNIDVAAVDGNVLRVYARLFDIASPVREKEGNTRIRKIADRLLPGGQARLYNQALMELGGLVCTPKNPDCESCPVSGYCLALEEGTVTKRPVTGKTRKTLEVTRVAGLVFSGENLLLLQRKEEEKLWAGLWDFPGGEMKGSWKKEDVAEAIRSTCGLAVRVKEHLTTVVHHYTRYKITLHCFHCELLADSRTPVTENIQTFCWIKPQELADYPLPAGARKIREYLLTPNT